MKKIIIFIILAIALLPSVAMAQDSAITVTGKITDEDGQPMVGVGVVISGTLKGVLSDEKGEYAILVGPDQEIQFSTLGYKTEIVKPGKRTVINLTMKSDVRELESAVVTALGIKREEKSLGYSTQTVGEETFANATASTNWISELTGKVAGLNIATSNSGPAGSTRVTLRGDTTPDLSNNTALFVIDGVPMFNTATSAGVDAASSIDYGDGTADVNPEDIESVTVLKGPAATALYGSSAANGAIIITTKSASKQQSKVNVTFSSALTFETVNTSPDLQYEYGQGNATADYYYYSNSIDNGKQGYNPMPDYNSQSGMVSYGPKMDGTLYYQYYDDARNIGGYRDEAGNFVRVATPFVSYGDWFKDFFETGNTWVNTLTVSGRINRKNAVRISITDVRKNNTIPNSSSNSQRMSLKSNNELAKWFRSEVSLNYLRNFHDNIPQGAGYGASSVMYSLWNYAPNIDMDWLKHDYWLKGYEGTRQNSTLSGGKNNAYFVANESVNTQNRYRLYGNVKLDFDLYKGLTLMVRGGVDIADDFRTQRQATGTQTHPEGWYREQDISSCQYSGDFLLRYDRRFKHDLRLTATFGGNILYRSYDCHTQTADYLVIPGLYTLTNAASVVKPSNNAWERQTNSLYGLLQMSWRNSLFVDVTGRNDWSSTLPADNRSYFYPSVTASAVLNELFNFGHAGGLLNMLKVRASYAQVGHDTSPHKVEDYLVNNGIPGTYTNPSSKANATLKPQMVSSWETGIDLRLFRNRFNLDVTYYHTISKDIISSMPVSQSTGMSSVMVNAGNVKNQGVEIFMSGTLIKTADIDWKVYANWSLNRNKVLELGPGIDNWTLGGYSSFAYMYASVGDPMTSMYGYKYMRAPEGSYAVGADGKLTDVSGQFILDSFGFPQIDSDIEYIGDVMPDWKGGFGTTFSWKDLKFTIGFDGQKGGHIWSLTTWCLNARGKGVATLEGREGGLIPQGVIEVGDGNYKVFTEAIPKESISSYYGTLYSRACTEANFVSTEYLRLREVRLEYSLPKKLLSKTKVINGLSFSVFGNNLFIWSKFPGFDPTATSIRGHSLAPGFDILQMPGTAQYGASIKFTY